MVTRWVNGAGKRTAQNVSGQASRAGCANSANQAIYGFDFHAGISGISPFGR
jgi:hypothetical protein